MRQRTVNDAKAKGVSTGDVVRVFNDRGEILVGALVTHHPRARHRYLRGRMAWSWSAKQKSLCKHDCVNVL